MLTNEALNAITYGYISALLLLTAHFQVAHIPPRGWRQLPVIWHGLRLDRMARWRQLFPRIAGSIAAILALASGLYAAYFAIAAVSTPNLPLATSDEVGSTLTAIVVLLAYALFVIGMLFLQRIRGVRGWNKLASKQIAVSSSGTTEQSKTGNETAQD